MNLFKSNIEIIETLMDKETVLNKMKHRGAVVINDNFVFFGTSGGISGFVKTEDNKTKIHFKSEKSGGVQIFSIFWISGTLLGLIYGIYKIINEKSFDWLPIISLGLLIFGVLIMTLLSFDQSEQLKRDIKIKLKAR